MNACVDVDYQYCRGKKNSKLKTRFPLNVFSGFVQCSAFTFCPHVAIESSELFSRGDSSVSWREPLGSLVYGCPPDPPGFL